MKIIEQYLVDFFKSDGTSKLLFKLEGQRWMVSESYQHNGWDNRHGCYFVSDKEAKELIEQGKNLEL